MKRRIAVVGAGAIGIFYGGMLARAGHELCFLARSDFSTAKAEGYTIELPDETFSIRPSLVANSPEEIGEVDLVLVALKTTANNQLGSLVPPLVGKQTLVLTLQNGLGNVEALAEIVSAVQVLGGLCFTCATRTAPARVRNVQPGRLYLGEFLGSYRERTLELVETFEAAGVETYFSRSLEESLWRKQVWNVPFNGLTIVAGGVTCDVVVESESLSHLAMALMEEVRKVAHAYGVQISDDFLASQLKVTRKIGAYAPSTLLDWKEGNALEIESIWGEGLRRGLKKRLALPRWEMLYCLLKSWDQRKP